MDDVIQLTAALVAIPSQNPMGGPASSTGFLETEIAAFVEQWLRDRGIHVTRDPVLPGRDNLIARVAGSPGAPTVLFDVHLDTVPAAGMSIDPFAAKIDSGRLYGRGACDVKASLAAMLVAVARRSRGLGERAAGVVLACTVDEEYTHRGSSRLAASAHGTDLAIVAEPTSLDLVDRHKGATRWMIRTHGVACHSSSPDRGVNAIYAMADVVHSLRTYADQLAHSAPDPVLGPPSLSVGRIEGGRSVNIVPDRCSIEIDRRLIPGERPSDAIGAVDQFLKVYLDPRVVYEFDPPWVEMPALEPGFETHSARIEAIRAAVARAAGRRPKTRGVPFGTDAGPLGAKGLPCLVFGPGDIAQAHTADEWVDLDQTRQAAEAYHEILVELAST